MTAAVQYPKRIVHNEAFACQYNVIEKTLIEVKNQPSGFYTNTNTKRKNNQAFKVPTDSSTASPINLYTDSQFNVRESGMTFTEPGVNSFSAMGGQQESQLESSSKSYFFDPFQPVDLNKDSVQVNRNIFNSPLNLGYSAYATKSSAPSIWGDSKSQGLSKSTSVWA